MATDGITEKFLDALNSRELLFKLSWDEWLKIGAPYTDRPFTNADVTVRYTTQWLRLGHARHTYIRRKRKLIRAGHLYSSTAAPAAKRSWT